MRGRRTAHLQIRKQLTDRPPTKRPVAAGEVKIMNNQTTTFEAAAGAAPVRTAPASPHAKPANQHAHHSTDVRARQVPNRLLAHALRYALAGLAIFPCRGKVPLTEHGYLDATTDLETIAGWWQRWPSANIGLPMAPNGLMAIDVDPRNGGTLAALDLPADLKTWRAATGGGGQHIVFAAPAGVDDVPATLGPGIDVKFHGYIVVDPSVHPDTGKVYRWLPNQSPWDIDQPAPVPANLLERMTLQAAPQAAKTAPADHEHAQTRPDGATVPLDVVESALRSIGPWDGPYPWWLSMFMAVHSEHPGQDGLAVAEAWADGKPGVNGKPSEVARKWAGFDPNGGVGIGTLLREARQHGWIDPRKVQQADVDEVIPAHWRITQEDYDTCPMCRALYVERFSDGTVRRFHRYCRQPGCVCARKAKIREQLRCVFSWKGVRTEIIPGGDKGWRSWRRQAKRLIGTHFRGIPQPDGNTLAVYESDYGEDLDGLLEVAAAALLMVPEGKILRTPRERKAPADVVDAAAEPALTAELVKPRAHSVELLCVHQRWHDKGFLAVLDRLGIAYRRGALDTLRTDPLDDSQFVALRSALMFAIPGAAVWPISAYGPPPKIGHSPPTKTATVEVLAGDLHPDIRAMMRREAWRQVETHGRKGKNR